MFVLLAVSILEAFYPLAKPERQVLSESGTAELLWIHLCVDVLDLHSLLGGTTGSKRFSSVMVSRTGTNVVLVSADDNRICAGALLWGGFTSPM